MVGEAVRHVQVPIAGRKPRGTFSGGARSRRAAAHRSTSAVVNGATATEVRRCGEDQTWTSVRCQGIAVFVLGGGSAGLVSFPPRSGKRCRGGRRVGRRGLGRG